MMVHVHNISRTSERYASVRFMSIVN